MSDDVKQQLIAELNKAPLGKLAIRVLRSHLALSNPLTQVITSLSHGLVNAFFT